MPRIHTLDSKFQYRAIDIGRVTRLHSHEGFRPQRNRRSSLATSFCQNRVYLQNGPKQTPLRICLHTKETQQKRNKHLSRWLQTLSSKYSGISSSQKPPEPPPPSNDTDQRCRVPRKQNVVITDSWFQPLLNEKPAQSRCPILSEPYMESISSFSLSCSLDWIMTCIARSSSI